MEQNVISPTLDGLGLTGAGDCALKFCYRRSADDYGHLGIARRTFFRWKAAGEAAADMPPFDEPAGLEAWYERLRALKVFKHRFPQDVREAVAIFLRGAAPEKNVQQAAAVGDEKHVPPSFTADHGVAQGLKFEIEAAERRVAALRIARDEAYQKKDRVEGDALANRHLEALDALSLVQQRYLKIAAEEGRLVPVELIEREFAPKISSIVTSGMLLFDRVSRLLSEAPDHATRRTVWRKAWIEHCAGLVQGRFAPALNLEALVA